MNRKDFIRSIGLTAGSLFALHPALQCNGETIRDETILTPRTEPDDFFFKISLAEWSLNQTIFSGKLSHLDFPVKAKKDFDITAVEYVNQFFKDKANDQAYLTELKKRCDDNNVTSVLIMCDEEGALGDLDQKKRQVAVENHRKWLNAAKFLGCHAIRVNSFGVGSREEVAKAATEGLHDLSEIAKEYDLNVIVENHGGYSSDGKWLQSVIKGTGNANCGTLPDFSNFCLRRENGELWGSPCIEMYDRYKGVEEMLPYAKGVSAKTIDFDNDGNCVETDYTKMLSLIKASGFTGYMGIEYSGNKIPEDDGIRKTLALLQKIGRAIR